MSLSKSKCWYSNNCLHFFKVCCSIVNDASKVVSEWCHNLEHHAAVINYDPRWIIYTPLQCLSYRHHLWQSSTDNRNMFIVKATSFIHFWIRYFTNSFIHSLIQSFFNWPFILSFFCFSFYLSFFHFFILSFI
jgi:hypothetical protein